MGGPDGMDIVYEGNSISLVHVGVFATGTGSLQSICGLGVSSCRAVMTREEFVNTQRKYCCEQCRTRLLEIMIEEGKAKEAVKTSDKQYVDTDDQNVNQPSHYTTGTIEVIECIEGMELDYHRGNAVKYIARAPHKGKPIQDIEKAIWYLKRWLVAQEKEGS